MEIKYSILTYLFNDYDIVREPLEISAEAEYILVTDNPALKSDKWTIKMMPDFLKNADGFTKSFYVRYHPFEFVKTDTCIVLDASLHIKKNLNFLINDFLNSGDDLCLSVHWNMLNSWNEYNYWVNYRNYPIEQARKSAALMKALGYSPNYKGCFEATFKIQKNNKINSEINDFVWKCLVKLGDENHVDRVDQSILSAVMNTQFENVKVFPITRSLYQSDYVMAYEHHCTKELRINLWQNQYYLFNKPVNLYEIHNNK